VGVQYDVKCGCGLYVDCMCVSNTAVVRCAKLMARSSVCLHKSARCNCKRGWCG
jgi:hypothetical protein